jgi:predicted phage-related endonuclease
VTGRSHAWVVAQIGGEPPEIRRVDRDDELIGHLRAAEQELWEMVESRTPPALEGGAARSLVDRLFPAGVPGKRYDADADFAFLLRNYVEARAEEKTAREAKEALGAEIALRMGDATEAYRGDRLIATRISQTRATASVAALRERHPDAADDVITETSFRVLRPKIKES